MKETATELYRSSQIGPDVPQTNVDGTKIVNQLRKLRWIDMEQEAQRLQAALDQTSSGAQVDS